MDAELGLQRSSTNPPLQTAPEESQMPTVAAGPGSSESGTNVVPRQVALEKDVNQQGVSINQLLGYPLIGRGSLGLRRGIKRIKSE